MTTHNVQPSYVKHLLGSNYVFFTLFGDWVQVWGVGGWGSPNGVVHNPLMQFFALYSSKIEKKVCKTYCVDIVTTHNDQPSYAKHVLGNRYVFFTLFGDWVLGGGWGVGGTPNGVAHNLLMQVLP